MSIAAGAVSAGVLHRLYKDCTEVYYLLVERGSVSNVSDEMLTALNRNFNGLFDNLLCSLPPCIFSVRFQTEEERGVVGVQQSSGDLPSSSRDHSLRGPRLLPVAGSTRGRMHSH